MDGSQTQRTRLVGKVVYREYGLRCIMNEFYVIVDETPKTVLLKQIEAVQNPASQLVTGRRGGTEIPGPVNEMAFISYDPNSLIRAQKHEPIFPGDQLWFSYKANAYFLWDGRPRFFEHMT